jgi:hypothetical protein
LPAALAKINRRRQGLERTMAQVSPQEQFFKIAAKDSLPGCPPAVRLNLWTSNLNANPYTPMWSLLTT